MIRKHIFIILMLSTGLLAAFCLPARRTERQQFGIPGDTIPSALVLYGSYIYHREGCNSCHSLVYETGGNNSMVCLDGTGDDYSAAWHFRHLKNPSFMIVDSRMPAFPALFVNAIDSTKLLQLYLEQNSHQHYSDSAIIYKKLREEALSLAQTLQIQGIAGRQLQRREVTALIAYLQQIPVGPQRRFEDSVFRAERSRLKASWDHVVLEDSGSILRLASSTDKETVAAGAGLFRNNSCNVCHGTEAQGGAGPNLTDGYWIHGGSGKQIIYLLKNGVPDRGMQSFKNQLSPQEAAQLAAYIQSLKGSLPKDAKEAQGHKEW